jgi:hypothetical protein
MSEPVAERIVAEVAQRLELIIAPTYQFSVSAVVRGKKSSNASPQDRQIYVSIDSLDNETSLDLIGNPPAKGYRMIVRCSLSIASTEADALSADTWRMRGFGAITQALTSVAEWWRWNKLAINTTIGNPELQINGALGSMGVHVPVEILFRTDENNPYNPRA